MQQKVLALCQGLKLFFIFPCASISPGRIEKNQYCTRSDDDGKQGGLKMMAQGKVEICGVNTSKLPLLTEEEKEELLDA